jgi:hypothetical protein
MAGCSGVFQVFFVFIAYRWGKQGKPRRQAWSGEYLQGEKKARPAFLKKPWFYSKKTGFSRVGSINNNAHVCCVMHKIKASLYNRVTGYGETVTRILLLPANNIDKESTVLLITCINGYL